MFSIKLKRIDLLLIQIFLGLFPFLFGGFYEFTAYFAQIFLLAILLIKLLKQKKAKIYINISSISILFISLGYLISSFYAIDKGMAFLGFLKFTVPLTFLGLLMQYKKEHIIKMLDVIPISGIIMIILSLLFRYIPFLPDAFYLPNGRMGGFFQYSNTFALYLLIGIICNVNSKNSNIKIIITTIILLIGIFLSGSRTVFVLTIISFIMLIVKFKTLRKYLIIILMVGIGSTFFYAILTRNFSTIGRYLSMSLNSSTLWGRILYYKDALNQIMCSPFGVGYMGYSYIQHKIQTGVYNVVYVHNDFLQLILDIGIIPTVIFFIAIVKSIIKSKNYDIQKQILLIIFLHILVDFDLQFMSIFFIVVMTLDIIKGQKIIINVNRYVNIAITIIVSILYLYFGICTFMQYLSKSNIAAKMYSSYTEANINNMCDISKNDLEKANKIANDILKTNKNVQMAYNVKALYYMEKQNWNLMLDNKEKSMELAKYDADNYNEYVLMLSGAIDFYAKNDDMENCIKYIKLVVEVPSKIEQITKLTSDIAYKLKDSQEVKLSENVQNYIKSMEGVLENE